MDPVDQPADRDRGRRGGLCGRRGPPAGGGRLELRRRRRVDADRRSDGAGVRGRGGRPLRLGHDQGARADRRRRRHARGVRGDRDAVRVGSARAVQGADEVAADGEQRRAAVQRGAVPDVVRELPLPPAGARPLAPAHGPDVPADDADDHAGGLSLRPAGQPLRRAHRALRRPDDADRRHVADGADRFERQRDRLHHGPGSPDRGGHRDVDSSLHDRRHPRRQEGPGGARARVS